MMVGYTICWWIVLILSIFSAPIMLWMGINLLIGIKKPKALIQQEEKEHRFAVLICARNEENVIGNLLSSLHKQTYQNYEIFVVADNCTDDTAKVCAAQGAHVYERFNENEKGKGYALHWGINRLLKEHTGEFDALCVFDADNLAAPEFLTEMNAALCSGADVALGYRDTKNVHDSWVSEVYSIYWLMLQRFYHAPRHTIGLSSMVGGTGFAFKLSALGEEGWTTYSLTEDVEFSIQQILKGNKIVPARKAVFYDEQPETFGVSVKQRLRWIIGGMQCIPLYFKQIMKSVFRGNLKALDMAWYVLFIPATGLALPLNVAAVLMFAFQPAFAPNVPWIILGIVAWNILFGIFAAVLTLGMEGKKMRPMLRGILCYPLFLISMIFLSFGAMFKPHMEWVPIAHSSKYTIEDVDA